MRGWGGRGAPAPTQPGATHAQGISLNAHKSVVFPGWVVSGGSATGRLPMVAGLVAGRGRALVIDHGGQAPGERGGDGAAVICVVDRART